MKSGEAKSKKKKAFLAASLAGLLAVTGGTAITTSAYAAGTHCYGINACKGTGDCGGKGHSCAGKNSCGGKGWIGLADADTCLKIKGGSLEAIE